MNWFNDLIDTMFAGDYAAPAGGPRTVLLALLLAFVLGHLVSWVYMWTHAGLSYSRTFSGSLLVMPVIVSLFMTVPPSTTPLLARPYSELVLVFTVKASDPPSRTTLKL